LRENSKKYDVIVGMFHDQVLAPFKALFGFDAVNITLGLPYIRMSPDHGVAEDKKKLNISSPKSLNRCIEIITKTLK
jgi:4-hydroxy-L-threonine phosphate dehydrogenase PdxA